MRRTRAGAVLVGLALLAFGATAHAEQPTTPGSLFAIPVESAGPPVAPTTPLRLRLDTADAARLAEALGVPAPPAGGTSLEYTLAGYPSVPSPTDRRWLEPTWVVDFDEPDVAALHRAFVAERREQVTSDAIVAYVADAVRGSLESGFEIASAVARRRSGDCTEYAVLTAALARASGLPARVVLGLALVQTPNGYGAYGHAWTETLEGGHWRVADAALARAPDPVRYLPLGVLEDEGPGYAMNVARLLPLWVKRIVVVGAGPAS